MSEKLKTIFGNVVQNFPWGLDYGNGGYCPPFSHNRKMLKNLNVFFLLMLGTLAYAEVPGEAINIVGSIRSALIEAAMSVIVTLAPFWGIYILGVKMGWIDKSHSRSKRDNLERMYDRYQARREFSNFVKLYESGKVKDLRDFQNMKRRAAGAQTCSKTSK